MKVGAEMQKYGDRLGEALAWPAPAKLNLCLHIIGRRADGYHLLQSAIQFIDLCDEIAFFARPDGIIERVAGPAEIPADLDLSIRAARLLAREADVRSGVGIHLVKNIPSQAGLGGGSSDAATVLVALNRLWGIEFGIERLAKIALELGADVPVFVRGHAAWVEGVGERIEPAEYPENWYLVVKPSASVSTAEIFQAAELTRNSPITTIRAFLAGGGRNDCTSAVRGRYPEVAEALDWLQVYGEARLTGTGACVFAVLPDEKAAKAAKARLPARWAGFIVRGMNRSPLLDRLAGESED
jgi:4-diphosphocytidyl-2-C-methyl-D-erythritol kinase